MKDAYLVFSVMVVALYVASAVACGILMLSAISVLTWAGL